MATAAPAAVDLSSTVSNNPRANGLAVIISNDYAQVQQLKTLDGTLIDAHRMKSTFERLNFAVLQQRNVTQVKLMALLKQVASYERYPPSYRRLAIVFSGHGSSNHQLYTQDGKAVDIEGMFQMFFPERAHHLGNIPKLFFIDACRGDTQAVSVMVPKGGEERKPLFVPEQGNFLVAYSTTPGRLSYEKKGSGGLWMSLLARKLESEDASVLDILTRVNTELVEMYQEPGQMGVVQQPELVSRLNEEVYLLRESRCTGEEATVFSQYHSAAIAESVQHVTLSLPADLSQPMRAATWPTARSPRQLGPPVNSGTPSSSRGRNCSSTEASPWSYNTTLPSTNDRRDYLKRLDSSPPHLAQAMTRGISDREKLEQYCVQKKKPRPKYNCKEEEGQYTARVYVAQTIGWVEGGPRQDQDSAEEDAAAKLLTKLSIH